MKSDLFLCFGRDLMVRRPASKKIIRRLKAGIARKDGQVKARWEKLWGKRKRLFELAGGLIFSEGLSRAERSSIQRALRRQESRIRSASGQLKRAGRRASLAQKRLARKAPAGKRAAKKRRNPG